MTDATTWKTVTLRLTVPEMAIILETLKSMHAAHCAIERQCDDLERRRYNRHRAKLFYSLMGRFDDAFGDPI